MAASVPWCPGRGLDLLGQEAAHQGAHGLLGRPRRALPASRSPSSPLWAGLRGVDQAARRHRGAGPSSRHHPAPCKHPPTGSQTAFHKIVGGSHPAMNKKTHGLSCSPCPHCTFWKLSHGGQRCGGSICLPCQREAETAWSPCRRPGERTEEWSAVLEEGVQGKGPVDIPRGQKIII